MLRAILLGIVLLIVTRTLPANADDIALREQAIETLRKATDYYRTKVAVGEKVRQRRRRFGFSLRVLRQLAWPI
jgi:hypothetical protein